MAKHIEAAEGGKATTDDDDELDERGADDLEERDDLNGESDDEDSPG